MKKTTKFLALALALVLCFGLAACGTSNNTPAQNNTNNTTPAKVEFPTKEIRFVDPWAAGGNTDLDGRMIASIVQKNKLLEKEVVVTNITGANTMNGLQAVMDADPDGHTLFLVHTAFLSSSVNGTVSITYNDLDPLYELSSQPFVLTLAKDNKLGLKTAQDVIDYANAHPGDITIGYVNVGSTSHMAAALFLQAVGIFDKVKQVPYSSGTDAITAHMAGDLIIRVGPSADNARYITSGDMIPMAISCPSTNKLYEGVPSFSDFGANVTYACHQGLFCRKEVPQEVRDIIIKALDKAVADSEYKTFCDTNGMDPTGISGTELKTRWDNDYKVIEDLVKSGVLKGEK